MRYLIVIYAVCSAIAGYMMLKNTYGNSLESEIGASQYNQFALGNYGFSKYHCEIKFIGLMGKTPQEVTELKCPAKRTISEIAFAGIAPFNADYNYTYTHDVFGESPVGFDYCGNPDILKE